MPCCNTTGMMCGLKINPIFLPIGPEPLLYADLDQIHVQYFWPSHINVSSQIGCITVIIIIIIWYQQKQWNHIFIDLSGKTTSCMLKNVFVTLSFFFFQNACLSRLLILVNLILNCVLIRLMKMQLIFSGRMENAKPVISAQILSDLDYEQHSGSLLTSRVNCDSCYRSVYSSLCCNGLSHNSDLICWCNLWWIMVM